MQDVNNDMDDLFRKAAEQYPLQTGSANWQKVLAGLQDASVLIAEEKEKKKRRFLWLFLLLPLGLLWAVHYKSDNQPEQPAAVVREEVKHRDNDSERADSRLTDKSSSDAANSSAVSGFSSGEIKDHKKTIAVDEYKASVVPSATGQMHQRTMPGNRLADSVSLKNKNEDSGYKQLVASNYVNLANNIISNQARSYKNNSPGSQPDALLNRIDKTSKQNNSDQSADETVKAKADSIASIQTKTDSAVSSNGSDNKSKPVKAKPHIQPGFYGGILGSFDVSTIKLQRVNKTGYGLQILIGYRFSNRLSIESGLGGTVKNYYSKGKYFDKTKTGIPDIVNIYYTNGYCKMFEVPLNIKYDFASTKKGNLFATAGFTSYFMKKENYSYRGDYRGRVYDTTRYYNNSGANWFSSANVSVGYETKLGRHSSLRIEPYIKVPLHGIGIAGLPIASMGISAGFTRKF